MLKKLKLVAFLFVLLLVISGCAKSEPSIVGEWQSETDNIKMVLNADGTFLITDESLADKDLLAGKYRTEGDQIFFTPEHEAEIANTYALKGDSLTLTYKDIKSTFNRVKK